MDKKEIISSIKTRISELQIMEEELISALSRHAEGNLIISSESSINRYYLKTGDKKKYLGHQDTPLIVDLLQKRYESKLIEEIRKEIKALQTSLKYLCSKRTDSDMDSVFASLPQEFRSQIVPFSGTADSFIKDWLSQSSYRAQRTENHLYETIGKDLVRSKSEVIIADRLWKKGIPYKYEQMLVLGDVFETYRYYPDFTILNKRTRQTFYWEHLGKLGDENYCNTNIQKLDIYAQYGIIQGKNLILTYESKSRQISTKMVDIMIEEYLS